MEAIVTGELTTDCVSLANHVAGTVLATDGDPWGALVYAVTAGVTSPIVLAITRRHEGERRALLSGGAAACVTLPFTAADVSRVIPVLTPHVPAMVDSTLRLLLDPIDRAVYFRGNCVHLSQREFAVLHCLSSNRGKPVPAEQLMASVWADTRQRSRNRQILDVYVYHLRRKLEQLGLKGAIATVRAYGYTLVEPRPSPRQRRLLTASGRGSSP